MFMRGWMHVYTKFEGQFVVLARLFLISFVAGLTFVCVYAKTWRLGALLTPIEVAARVVAR